MRSALAERARSLSRRCLVAVLPGGATLVVVVATFAGDERLWARRIDRE